MINALFCYSIVWLLKGRLTKLNLPNSNFIKLAFEIECLQMIINRYAPSLFVYVPINYTKIETTIKGTHVEQLLSSCNKIMSQNGRYVKIHFIVLQNLCKLRNSLSS